MAENDVASQYDTYSDYLDSFIASDDLFYLEDQEVARRLVELGIRTNGDILTAEEFEQRRKVAEVSRLQGMTKTKVTLASAGKDLSDFPLLYALAQREELVRSGKLAVIIFIRDKNHAGQEISGYVDFGHRLRLNQQECEAFFLRTKKLLPRSSDLSFYNWETQYVSSMASANFEVIADHEEGFLFKCKRDRKVINVNPRVNPGDKTRRHVIETDEYIQVVLYDHILRRKV
ncbi:protein of unknown function DUF4464 [Kipferlia bialata]|uniref:Cilia- and flagella-associated protein 299 n=1 Tax=Kipferlia bialata TaxID=797122 RepID=A0A9K3GK17_9EUKA|nr:protein of unknown function DUF4464 [Kipferlia bialata]|eukprot:g7438.t1